MADELYCYPGTDILRNKLDIHDHEKLHIYERKLTMLRLRELIKRPMEGNFDLEYLQAIHRYIFQDIYDWAGELRKVEIAKGNMFCKVIFIKEQADKIFEKLKNENYLAGLEKEVFSKRLAYYFSEINALHPFREGNGRSQREFIRSLSLKNGYILYFADASQDEMIEASKDSFLCDYRSMETLFEKCMRKSII